MKKDPTIDALNSREWVSVLRTPEELERLWNNGPYIDIRHVKSLVIGSSSLFGRKVRAAEA